MNMMMMLGSTPITTKLIGKSSFHLGEEKMGLQK